MTNNEALELLRDIRQSTFRNAASLPHKEEVQAHWQGLGFQVGGVRLVSRIGEVGELMQVPRVTTLPAVKSWVRGIANVRGRLIPIVDLHLFLNLPTTMPTSHWRVMVVEDEDVVAGLIVEQSLGMQHFAEDTFEPAAAEGLETLAPYVTGAFRHGGRVYHEIKLRSILRDDEFFNVAQSNTLIDD